MKFDDLYNRVFIKEQDETEVADPTSPDFNDVEPAPLPDLAPDAEAPVVDQADAITAAAPNLSTYMQDLIEFGSKLMDEKNPDQSLLAVLRKLDKPGIESPFSGIYDRTCSQILSVKNNITEIVNQLLRFSIQAKK